MSSNKEGNIIFSTMQRAEEEFEKNIPDGYLEISLSSNGRLGAPKTLHIRNFKVRDIVALSLTNEVDLPKRLIEILNSMIYEKDVDVGNFHESEVEELMVYLYIGFFRDTLEGIPFSWDENDLEYVRKNLGEELADDLKNKKWKPTVDIVLSRDLDTYDLPDDFNSKITITNKKTKFYVTFDYMKYKDRLIIKKWIDDLYKNEEARFHQTKEIVAHNNQILMEGGEPNNMIPIDPEEESAYKDYVSEKLQVVTEASRLVSVVDYNGKDVSNLSLSEKYKLMSEDPRIDYGMISKLSKKQSQTPFGIKPDVHMENPLTHQPCTRRLSFRISSILQAIQVFGDSEYDDGDNDADINVVE